MGLSRRFASGGVRIDGHGPVLPRRLINRLNGRDVSQPFHTVSLRVTLATDAVGKMVQLQNKFVHHFEILLEPSALDLAKEPALFFEGERGVQGSPSFVAVDLHERRGPGTVARRALADQASGMSEAEGDAVFDVAEAFGVVGPGMGR